MAAQSQIDAIEAVLGKLVLDWGESKSSPSPSPSPPTRMLAVADTPRSEADSPEPIPLEDRPREAAPDKRLDGTLEKYSVFERLAKQQRTKATSFCSVVFSVLLVHIVCCLKMKPTMY